MIRRAKGRDLSQDRPTVLLASATGDDRTMYAEYLRACGLTPIEVDNTADALHHAGRVDVVVTGIRVDGPFDGVELVRQLRQNSDTRTLPIIVLTACVFKADHDRAVAAGCDRFLGKPLLPELLVREIHAVLGNGGAVKARPERAVSRSRRRRAS